MMPQRLMRIWRGAGFMKLSIFNFFFILPFVFYWAYFPALNGYLHPIILGFKIDFEKSYRDASGLYMQGFMKMDRKGDPGLPRALRDLEDRCEFQGVTVYDQAGDKLPLWFMDSEPQGETADRMNGSQPWGPWRVGLGVDRGVGSTTAIALHECRYVWPIKTPSLVVSNEFDGEQSLIDVHLDMEYHVSTWFVRSTLWENIPITDIRTSTNQLE